MRAISTIAVKNTYLHERHFIAAILIAMVLHLIGLTIWMFAPRTPVVEIPVRVLNIKLGEQEEEVDIVSSIKQAPEVKNSNVLEKEMARFFEQQPTPMPANPEALAHALSKAVRAGKEALQPKQPEAKPPAPKPQPQQPQVSAQTPHQYVRNQTFDYRPVEKQALAKNNGSALGNKESSQAEIMARYEQLISAWIEKFKVYPAEAHNKGVQGQGIVDIRIDRKGNVRFVSLDKSTGSAALDRAIMEMIHDANPLPPMPDGYKSGEALVEFKIPINFKL